MIKTVIFDLDDTLYNEIDYCKSGYRCIAAHLHQSYPDISEDTFFNVFWNQFISGDCTKIFNSALEALKIDYDKDSILRLVQLYRNHIPILTLPENSRSVLKKLKNTYRLGLLTDGFMPAQQLKVKALEIEHYFDCIIYTELLGRENWKPSSTGFEKLLQDLDTQPEQAVYVADNITKDFIAPNKLNMISIQLVNPNAVHHQQTPSQFQKPQFSINSLTLLPDLLTKL
jgi:putative hydrolase of the HAD superfamily